MTHDGATTLIWLDFREFQEVKTNYIQRTLLAHFNACYLVKLLVNDGSASLYLMSLVCATTDLNISKIDSLRAAMLL